MKLTAAIEKYTPVDEKDIRKKSDRYESKKMRIINQYIGTYNILGDDCDEGDAEKLHDTQFILILIGMEFAKWFQKLITPPNGRERVPIHLQISKLVDKAVKMDLEQLFDGKVAEHVYYIVGFLCDAGSKEALRRSKKSNVGECIKAINSHFAIGRDEEKVREIKQSLPQGVTNLVDQRCHFGHNCNTNELHNIWRDTAQEDYRRNEHQHQNPFSLQRSLHCRQVHSR